VVGYFHRSDTELYVAGSSGLSRPYRNTHVTATCTERCLRDDPDNNVNVSTSRLDLLGDFLIPTSGLEYDVAACNDKLVHDHVHIW
jgi:hypothetical protein